MGGNKMTLNKTLGLVALAGAIGLTSMAGCARFSDNWSAKGSLIGSTKDPYIVVNQSGGVIMDVYKLDNAIVQSPEGSDGWLFVDDGKPIYLGGDVKTIRLDSKDDPLWDKYHEYHMEFESRTYRDLYNAPETPK